MYKLIFIIFLQKKHNMKSIGFRNFRKFKEFPNTSLGNINILVGKNNSGKSTLVKATLLVLNYLKSNNHQEFPFSTQLLTDANINSFDRALRHNSKEKTITFSCQLSKYIISLTIQGEENRNSGIVQKLCVEDSVLKITVTNNFIEKTVTILKENTNSKDNTALKEEIKSKIKSLQIKKEEHPDTSPEAIKLNDKINAAKKKDRALGKKGSVLEDNNYSLEYSYIDDTFSNYQNIINTISQIGNELLLKKLFKKDSVFTKCSDVDIERASKDHLNIIQFASNFNSFLNEKEAYYISAIIHKQSELFLVKDKENSLAQTIHEYMSLNISGGETEDIFIKDWMKEFEIGDGFEINKQTNEAYTVKIYNSESISDLADMGLGSLHTMNLLIRIASIIRKNGKKVNNNIDCQNVTLILEEPGQCLHPNLQAKLAEFMDFVYKTYKIQFIIETHSEYIVRSSQLIVNKNQYSEEDINPFKTYYFELNDIPYEMIYNENGKFHKKFGKGFMDVADKIALELFYSNKK